MTAVLRASLSYWLLAVMAVSLLATVGLGLALHDGVSVVSGALIGFACGPTGSAARTNTCEL